MSEALVLQLISSYSTQSLNVQWIEVVSPTGEFIVGLFHLPLISLVRPQSKLLYKKTDGSLGMFTIPGGVLRVEDNVAVLVLDSPLGE